MEKLGLQVIILHPTYCTSEANTLQGRSGGVIISSDDTIPKEVAPDDWFVPLRLVVHHDQAGKAHYHAEPWEKGPYVASGAEIFTSDERFPFKSLPLYDRIPPKPLSGDDEEVPSLGITLKEILAIAKHPFNDPELRTFTQRFLIAYTSSLSLAYVLKGGKKKIINGCLITKDQHNQKRIIPLHPIVLSILENPLYQNVAIPSNNINKYIREIALEAGINTLITFAGSPRDRIVPRYRFLYTQALSITAVKHKQDCGIPFEFMNLLSGYRLESPAEATEYKAQMDKHFNNRFYDCLNYLTFNDKNQ